MLRKLSGFCIIAGLALLGTGCQSQSESNEEERESSETENPNSSLRESSEEQQGFKLPEPNRKELLAQANRTGQLFLYSYLTLHFDTVKPKKLGKTAQQYRDNCEFSQEFENGILYYQDECASDGNKYQLHTPQISQHRMKEVLALLFSDEDLHWNTDSTLYRTSPDGLKGSGGEFTYSETEDSLKVNIVFRY